MFMAFTWSPDTLWLFLQKAWWFLVVLGVLVAFHELGHFLAALFGSTDELSHLEKSGERRRTPRVTPSGTAQHSFTIAMHPAS